MLIKNREYKYFSRDLHTESGHKPIVAQMELTYRCPLRCEHCYTDCFNNKKYAPEELSAAGVKKIMDKCKAGGVVWFCFTGGDPMMHKDFDDLYVYAKKLGFITSVFSPLVSMSENLLKIFKESPPFVIETTLNAATAGIYRDITKTGFFCRHIRNIKRLQKAGIPVKVKTQVTTQNIGEIKRIKTLVESLGLGFRPSTMLNARLDRNPHPCSLRLAPIDAVSVNERYGFFDDEESRRPGEKVDIRKLIEKPRNSSLLACAAGGHAFWISPQGRMLICASLRIIDYDLLKKCNSVGEGFYRLHKKIHGLKFRTKSKCRTCSYRLICNWCPGRAILETGSLERPIEYFCELTKEVLKLSTR